MKSAPGASREQAEGVAIQALTFIAGEPERLSRFLDMTGIRIERIRDAARERGFLAGVLEHMLADENLLIAFASQGGIDPADVVRAHGALSGALGKR